MRRRLLLTLAPLVIAAAALAAITAGCDSGSAASGDPGPRVRAQEATKLGNSVDGRAILARRLGDSESPRKVLVVGIVHGDEPAGFQVIRALRREHRDIRGVARWTVATINPDGWAAGRRTNAHGVDLNRNFSYNWSGAEPDGSGYYAGPHPFSEPEPRGLRDLIRRLHPALPIYFPQPWGQVLAPCRGDAALERHYSELSGVPLKRCRGEHLTGTGTSWQDHWFPGTPAFVVELPPGK